MPRTGETRYVPNQIFVAVPSTVPPARLEEIRGRLEFDEVGSATLESVGLTYCVWSFQGDRSVAEVAGQLAGEPDLVSVQPNYRFQLSDELSIVPTDPASAGQYALEKLRAVGGLDRPGAEPVNVAVIDTAVDETHPDLAGVVVDRFDAIGSDVPVRSLDHGTAMAGAIAARGQVRGVAPSVHIFSARAFDSDGTGAPLGSSLTIAKAIDWAVRSGARIINLSFAGPRDPALHEILAGAAMKGVVLISAAGNAGPRSPPLYPAADENVIAITATDSEDHVYPMANVGRYVAAAAPGVDVLLPAPNGSYSLETGTSVAAALASGVAALTLERKPDATARDVKSWLTSGARPFATSAKKPLAGAGVIDATATVRAAEP